ncbi:MAG TPA: single-stranded-DNA-specific exonuclease RecJ, partial [Bryobacteraceae bacterium]|nr:single-stranded-DNA-specific exonuclease RecJ [Bryobacteraceae bacterium]
VERFLHPKLSDLYDPFLLRGMEAAVERVRRAIREQERVLVYGDYDVDGTTSLVILGKMLELAGLKASLHVPDRLKDGYGIQGWVLEEAKRNGVTLLISVDTGIRANAAVEHARALGIDVIITDHHLPDQELPPATAILNPNRFDCQYPNKNLCGAGVTFKLIQALMDREGWAPDRIVRYCDSFLMLVAIATVADVVPLTGENRIIVQRGLLGLSKTRNAGIQALLNVAGLDPSQPVSATDISFRIAPRINAAGRMDNASEVLDLFLTQDEQRARSIALRLDALNAERQRTCEAIANTILDRFAASPPGPDQAGLVFFEPEWHRGVVGIVASRVAETFHRPALVLGLDEASGYAQGSGRSIASFHLLEALETMPDLFVRFGGHRQAVGLTLERDRVDELRERFNEYVKGKLGEDGLEPERLLDAEISLAELTHTAVDEILSLAPFGLGNRSPVFLVRGARLAAPPEGFGKGKDHLRLVFAQNGGSPIQMKAWRFSSRAQGLRMGATVDLALTVESDSFSAQRGGPAWSATVRDVRPGTENHDQTNLLTRQAGS